jgi:hypothetical protein
MKPYRFHEDVCVSRRTIVIVLDIFASSRDEPKKKGPKKPKREETPLQVSAIELE